AKGVPVDDIVDKWRQEAQDFWTRLKAIDRTAEMLRFEGKLGLDGVIDDGKRKVSVLSHRSKLSGIAAPAALHAEAMRASAFVKRAEKASSASGPETETVVVFRAAHPDIKAHMRELARAHSGKLRFASVGEPQAGHAAREIRE